ARELGEAAPQEDEASYLIQTFRDTIATLKKQESELKQLHEIEKSRADDLETITSTLTHSLSSGFIALGPDGRVIEINHAAREIQSLADLGVMSAAIAHEFRNSLSTILGLLKLARRNELPNDVETKLVTAERESLELAEAVTGLLQFARPMRLQLSDVDLRALISDIVERFRDSTAATIEIRGPDVQMRGDASLLARAFENLIRNAIDATAGVDNPSIEIEINDSPDPSIEIRDNGIGIAEKDPANLF